MRNEEIGNDNYLKNIKQKGNCFIYNFGEFTVRIPLSSYSEVKLSPENTYAKEELRELFDLGTLYKIETYVKKLTSKKVYSSYDLKIKLMKKFNNSRLVNQVVEEYKEMNVINDEMFAKECYEILDEKLYGKYFIVDYLKKRGICDDFIKNMNFSEEREIEKCTVYFESIKNKFVSKNFTKQKKSLFNLMIKRGFELNVIDSVLNNLKINPEHEITSLKKDYQKYSYKYSAKFVGNKLRNKIVNALVTKGYPYQMISTVLNEMGEENTND